MSLEHAPARQRRRRSSTLPRVAVTINEFSDTTSLSRPTLYRMMQRGELHYTLVNGMRRIPVSEYRRLGLAVEEV
jgi:hypothetical protein